jgi:signal peptide peptidase-like protein 2B
MFCPLIFYLGALLCVLAHAEVAIFRSGQSVVYGVPAMFGVLRGFPSIRLAPAAANGTRAAMNACSPLPRVDDMPVALLVTRGNCTFFEKALAVQAAGAVAMVLANSDDEVFAMTGYHNTSSLVDVTSIMVSASDAAKWLPMLPMHMSIEFYHRPLFDTSGLMLFVLATGTVLAGAWWGSEPERMARVRRDDVVPAPPEDTLATFEAQYLDERAAYGFVVVASLMMLVLFYFIANLMLLLIAVYVVGASAGLAQLLHALLRRTIPSLDYSRAVYMLGEINILESLLWLPSLSVAIAWAVLRNNSYAWVLQDLLGICLLLSIQRNLRLPNIKVATILLCLAFFYDIFWVFCSSYFFQESVMVKVATGGNTGESLPMLLRMPRLNDALGGYSLLGLGDVALPGLFVSYTLRFDYIRRHPVTVSYFCVAGVGYALGLVSTFAGLVLMQSGQPALLYIVPCILIPVMLFAYYRGDLLHMWSGESADDVDSSPALPMGSITSAMPVNIGRSATHMQEGITDRMDPSNWHQQQQLNSRMPIATHTTAYSPLPKDDVVDV